MGQELQKPSEVMSQVTERIQKYTETGELSLPEKYSPANAMKAAWLKLQEIKDKNKKPALEVCTRASIYNALLFTVVQGLSPDLEQVYYIVRGNQLVAQRSYFGTAALAKRLTGAMDIPAQVVYQGDDFEYQIVHGRTQILKHTRKLENIDPNKIRAAYAIALFPSGAEATEIMTMDEIKKAWRQSQVDPEKADSVHQKWPEMMAKRTVIQRLGKQLANTATEQESFQGESTALQEPESGDPQEFIDLELQPESETPDEAPEPSKSFTDTPPEPEEPAKAEEPWTTDDSDPDSVPF